MTFKVSQYIDTTRSANGRDVLVFSTRSGQLLSVNSGLWEELERGEATALTDRDHAALTKAEILVPANENEFAEMMALSRSAVSSSRILARTIMVSSYCQLGCQYCGQQHSNATLDRTLADKLIEEIRRQLNTHAFTGLRITWFGGEPTTAPTVIAYLSEQFLEICRSTNVSYDAQIITNGFSLTRDLARRLVVDYKVSHAIISLDGVAEVHDRRRPTKQGRGSFDIIVANLVTFARDEVLSDCRLTVRINVGPDNASSVHELIELLADFDLAGRVSINCAAVVHWSQTAVDHTLPREHLANLEVGWLAHLLTRGFKTSLLPKPRPSACLASEPMSHVVATDGTIHNCTMTPLAEHVVTPSTSPLGHLDRPEPPDGSAAQESIVALLESKHLPCRECTMLFLCQGGCPKDLESGIVPCPTFKFNLRSRLALHERGNGLTRRHIDWLPEIQFPDRLSESERHVIVRSLAEHVSVFWRRFRPFQPPARVVVYEEAGFVQDSADLQDVWYHRLLPLSAYESRSPVLIGELALRYLARINSRLVEASLDGSSGLATEMVKGFVSWATGKFVVEPETEAPSATAQAFARLARHCCVDQFMTQSADVLSATWARINSTSTTSEQQPSSRGTWIRLQPVH
jgi:uncharacterized protein